MHAKATIAGLAVLVSATVGCGDDDDDDSGAGVSDEEEAESIVLTADDVPSSWEATPAEDEEDEEIRASLAECLGVEESELDADYPEADSPELTSPDDQQVQATVTFTPLVEDATRRMEIMTGQNAPVCYADALTAALQKTVAAGDAPADLAFGEVTFEPLAFPDLGDDSVAYRVSVPVTTQGTTVEVYLDQVAVRVGRVGISAQFLSPLTPFDHEEAARLTELMVDRVPS